MSIDADRLAKQVKLAYEFINALHGQAIALNKDVETQLAQGSELQLLRPGGYRFTVNPLSYGLERPQVPIADYYAVYFRHFEGRVKNTPLDVTVPPIGFLKIVFRERGLKHPEVRFGIVTGVTKPPEQADDKWPTKFEDLVAHLTARALIGSPPWFDREIVGQKYQDSYISVVIRGAAVRLTDLPNSEAIAQRIVDPLLAMYREAAG